MLAPSDDYVSQEQIISKLETLYKKYNVRFEYVNSLAKKNYTKEEVSAELMELESKLKSYNRATFLYSTLGNEDEVTYVIDSFYYDKTYTSYVNASNGITGNATIEIKCDTVIHGGTQEFVSISNIRTRQYGTASGFVSWTQIDQSYSLSSGGRIAEVTATGTLVTEAEILGQTIRETYDHTIVMTIQA